MLRIVDLVRWQVSADSWKNAIFGRFGHSANCLGVEWVCLGGDLGTMVRDEGIPRM